MLMFIPVLILLVELWLLAGLVLLLHRLSPRFGLAPLFILLGSLTSTLQLNTLGQLSINLGGMDLSFNVVSYIALPVILFGLLIVYVVDGTIHARSVLAGISLISLLIGLSGYFPPAQVDLPGISILSVTPGEVNPRLLGVSIITLLLDMVTLIVAYQGFSNLIGRFPSRLAGVVALTASLLVDALVFPTLSYFGLPTFSSNFMIHLAGKLLAAFMLSPMLVLYLIRMAPAIPSSTASIPRPALDIFTTNVQLEARARFQSNLLHILSQINQLIVRAENVQTILTQVCQLLTNHRNYQLVWVNLAEGESGQSKCAAMAGSE
ncbi:MAG: hypothetical protein EHM70_17765, partial [Chloroflexota bacterium]